MMIMMMISTVEEVGRNISRNFLRGGRTRGLGMEAPSEVRGKVPVREGRG